jgi:hypothetical protein
MAREISLRLYEELNDFLPPDKQKRQFAYPLDGEPTVEELLESLAVPKTNVELVLINGDPAGFSHRLKAGDSVSIYPVFESFDVTALVRLRHRPLRQTRFIAGAGLRRLAGYLRLLGFDTLDSGSWAPEKIIRVAEGQRRILLVRKPARMSAGLSRVYRVRAADPEEQLVEVLSRFDLYDPAHFARLRAEPR